MSIDGWMDREDVIHTHTHTHTHTTEYYSAIKKKEILPFVTTWRYYTKWNLEGIILSEISQTEKDKYCMISSICGLKNKYTKKTKLIGTGNRFVVSRGEWGWWGWRESIAWWQIVSRHTVVIMLQCIQISNYYFVYLKLI